MKLSSIINRKQADKELRRELGENHVLIIGNWATPNVKYHDSIKVTGFRRMLQVVSFRRAQNI
jgi:hypothetical protein